MPSYLVFNYSESLTAKPNGLGYHKAGKARAVSKSVTHSCWVTGISLKLLSPQERCLPGKVSVVTFLLHDEPDWRRVRSLLIVRL